MCYCYRKLDFQTFSSERMRERMHESSDWIGRSVTSVRTNQIRDRMRERIGADAGADTRSCVTCLNQLEALAPPLSHPLSCIRSHLSCDLSEPIRFAKVVSSPDNIRSRIRSFASALGLNLAHLIDR